MKHYNWPLFIFGILICLLGLLGIFLPILPTTPFLILGAFFFSKSNPKFYYYLIHHPRFGKNLFNWFEFGIINQKAKKMSVGFISASYLIVLWGKNPWTIKVGVFLILVAVICFILKRPSTRPTTILILGHGKVGSRIAQELISNKLMGTVKIYRTTRSDSSPSDQGHIFFDLNDKKSWDHLPFVDFTFWTLPANNSPHTLEFWHLKKHLLGKTIGIGTTSQYLPSKQETWIDENYTHIDTSHKRRQIENQMVKEGAIWGICPGLYDESSHPSKWLQFEKVHPTNFINLVHRQDCARALIHLALYSPLGEVYHLSDGRPFLWSDLSKYFVEKKLIDQKIYDQFMDKQKEAPKVLKKGKISNRKLMSLQDFTFKHSLVEDLS